MTLFRHLNVRVRNEAPTSGHVGVSVHLGRDGEPVRYGGLVQAELEGDLGLEIRAGEPDGRTTIVLQAGDARLTLDPAAFRRLVRGAS